jgi:hypothetical protein
MGNSCSCIPLWNSEKEVEPVRELEPLPNGKSIKQEIIVNRNSFDNKSRVNE